MAENGTVNVDAVYRPQGTVDLIEGVSKAGTDWLKKNTRTEPWQWVGNAIAVDPRYAGDVVAGMREAGLKVGT